jgi:hypothetical protein
MSRYTTIDGRSYYNPCATCKESSCYSCVLSKYKEDLQAERDKRTHAEFRVENELEPRIKAEERAYDRWVSTDTGAEACECFSDLINELINFVEDTDNSKHMEWEDASGDLEQKILYLIKNRVDDDTYYITEKQKVENNEK